MSYSRFMDRSLDDIPSDMHRKRGGEGDDVDDRTLFVANLNYITSWQELREHLRKAGHIEKCDIFKDSRGYSKGYGLVVFADAESAERAVRDYNDSVLNDRNMKIRKARPFSDKDREGERERRREKDYPSDASNRKGRPPRDPACTVFVHNLDYNVTWQKLKDIFKVVGHVVDVEVLESRKGAAIVQFDSSDDAIKAIALFHGQMLMDRPMQLRMDSKSPYQPDPLKLKLQSLQAPIEHSTRSEHHHSRQEHHRRHSHHEHHPRSRSRSPYGGLLTERREYSYSPPPRYQGNGYSRMKEEYYPLSDREDYYKGSERSDRSRGYDRGYDKAVNYNKAGGYDKGPRYKARSRSRSRSWERTRSPEWRGRDEQLITSVFVKNLPFSTTWQALKDEFRKAGLVKRAEIKMNKEGRPSGLALVFYNTHREASTAVSMFDDTNFDGRQISVQLNIMQHKQQQRY